MCKVKHLDVFSRILELARRLSPLEGLFKKKKLILLMLQYKLRPGLMYLRMHAIDYLKNIDIKY